MVAVQGQVAVYKPPPRTLLPPAPCLCALPGSVQHRDPVATVSSAVQFHHGDAILLVGGEDFFSLH
ncbi:unnamed protein product [Staurois parvus]|uniref:Uncharacterized protein n=1 Tax=Staurois parvus TaxID=386267 RepID=A0ABN9FPH8_9NEOB|nr:unnamed protein product [Staurois parvus]